MAVIRINKTGDYTVMSNTHFKEKELSLKAKGLLSLMLSLPDGWDYSINGLVTLSKDGRDSVMTALQELEQFRYLKRTRTNDGKGQFAGYDYDIYEKPFSEKPTTDIPNTDKPYTEKPNTEKPQQLNTNKSITKELSKKEINTKEIYNIVVSYLNEKAGTNFKVKSKNTQQHIHARIQEGFTVEDFKTVIDKKCAEWKGTDFEQYLRPATLFGAKFEGYLNAPAPARKTFGATGVEITKPIVDDLAGIL